MTDPTCPNGCQEQPWGVELQGVYDGIAYWTCPTCGANWHRWPEDPNGYNRIREACERVWAVQGSAKLGENSDSRRDET